MTIYVGRKATGLGIINTNKIVILVLAIVATFPGQVAAQPGGGMIAYSRCFYNDWLGELCNVGLVAADGSGNTTIIGDGILPALSRDGTKLAFNGFSQPGLFVLNLVDGSFANVPNFGWWPAWSPDGTKLAFSGSELY